MKNYSFKKYPETAKPFQICVKQYFFVDRKLHWIDLRHIKFYKTIESVKDAQRDITGIWLNNYDTIHARNGKKFAFREKYVVCTRDGNGMYKDITHQI